MNEAIRIAIEKGGYKFGSFSHKGTLRSWINLSPRIIQDPLFWQALGKALGWRDNWHISRYEQKDDVEGKLFRRHTPHSYAHQYFHLVLTGGDTERFWEDLLQ